MTKKSNIPENIEILKTYKKDIKDIFKISKRYLKVIYLKKLSKSRE